MSYDKIKKQIFEEEKEYYKEVSTFELTQVLKSSEKSIKNLEFKKQKAPLKTLMRIDAITEILTERETNNAD